MTKYTRWMQPREYCKAVGIPVHDGDFKAKVAMQMFDGRKFWASVLFTGFEKKFATTLSKAKEILREKHMQAAYSISDAIDQWKADQKSEVR